MWFAAGVGFAFAMRLSLLALANVRPPHWPVWWFGGLAFVAVELVAHLALRLRGRPCFYDGLG